MPGLPGFFFALNQLNPELTNAEGRIKADSKNINHQGINIEASHNAYMDYVSGKGSIDTAANAMADDIRSAIGSGKLTAPEIVKLQGALTEIVGDADLAREYISGGAETGSSYSGYLKMIDEVNAANKSGMSAREFAESKGVKSTLSDEDATILDKNDYRMEAEDGSEKSDTISWRGRRN